LKKVVKRGYAHHNERLMVLGNIMLISDFHPDEVYKYFMEMFIDAYDWIVVPSVYALSQYSDGGEYVDKPFVSSSNYIMSISNYKRGTWADVWDGLYWRFIEKNRALFAKNQRMALVLTQLDKLDPDRKRIISYRADDFLAVKTTS
jgi:deoxyribodipyrimidine photolyase-related protein